MNETLPVARGEKSNRHSKDTSRPVIDTQSLANDARSFFWRLTRARLNCAFRHTFRTPFTGALAFQILARPRLCFCQRSFRTMRSLVYGLRIANDKKAREKLTKSQFVTSQDEKYPLF